MRPFSFHSLLQSCLAIGLLLLATTGLNAASVQFNGQAFLITGNQDLESNTMVIGSPIAGEKYLFVSDPSWDVWFSGNNVRGTYYAINASNEVTASFYGEVTRLVKIGSNVIACQFYVYPNPADPLDTGSPAQTILINISGTFASGQTIKTSSDPVAAFLNSQLPQVSSPAAVADAGTAVEAGGLNNAVPGSDAIGNLLTNDSGASTDYSIDDSVFPPLFVETVGGVRVTAVINTAATASPTAVPDSGSVTAAGLYGSLAIEATGAYTYTVNEAHATVEALRLASDELQDVFTYTITDDRGNTSTSVLTVTIDGANDTPIAADDYNFAKESLRTDATAYDGTDTLGYKAEGSVLPNDSDVDRYGENLALTGLVAGATGTTVSSTVLNISGTTANVKAGYYVYQYDTGTGTRGAAMVTSGGAQVQVATITPSITLSGTPTVAINNGDTLYFALKADGSGSGGTALVASTSTSSGTNIALDTASLTGVIVKDMMVSGSGIAIGTTVAGVTYDVDGKTNGITLSQSAALSATALTFTAPLGTSLTGRYGTLTLEADGDYVYTPTPNNPEILQGESGVDAFTYRISDLEAATSDAVLYITVLGSSSQDPDAVADSLAAAESGGVANATAGTNPAASGPGLLDNDDTPDGGSLSITAAKSAQTGTATSLTADSVTAPGGGLYDVKLTGLYGDLYLKADGSSFYVVDNSDTAVEALKDGESLDDSFQYQMLNSVAGMVDWGLVTVSIAGAYDAPVAIADTTAASDLPTFHPSGNVLVNDTDVDAGDSKTVTRVAVGSVDLSLVSGEAVAPASTSTSSYTELTGSYGTLRLGADGSYVYLLDTSNAAVRALGEGQVMPAPDVFTYEVEDAGGLAGTATLTVAITGSNDAPVNTLPASVALEAGEVFNFTGGDALAVADLDDNLSSLRLTVQNGILHLDETGSSYDAVEGVITLAGGAKIYYQSAADGSAYVTENGTSGITLYGTQTQINAALASLSYTPDSAFSGDETLTLLAVDDGAMQDLDSMTLAVAAVPTVANIDVNEGSPYAVFTVSGEAGQQVELEWVSGTATSLDYGPGLQYWDGSDWVNYSDGDFVALPAGGVLLVRTSITSDAENEGAHAFQLKVSNSHGVSETATGTIRDDGTGSYWIGDATTPASAGDLTAAGLRLDDDRSLTVTSPTVNEASPFAVFKVCGIEGQLVGLELDETGVDYAAGDAELGVDTGTTLEYYDPLYDNGDTTYGAWRPYADDSYVAIPRVGATFDGEAGCLLVRVALVSDGDVEGAETFMLSGGNTGGTNTDGVGTIVDDGTGDIYLADNTDGDPNGPGDAGYPERLDDDRLFTVTSPTVNEASPFAVFKVCGIEGQLVGLDLGETGADYGAGDAELGADTGTTLEYYDPLYDNGDTTYGAWRPYVDGSYVVIPRVGATLDGEAGCLLVRVTIFNDAPSVFEDAETFTLTAVNTGGGDTVGAGTIVDDGTGDIFLSSNTNGDPNDPTDMGYPAELDDDGVSAPVVVSASVRNVTAYKATLIGEVNPGGASTEAWFEYSTDPTLGSGLTSTAHQNLGAGSDDVEFSQLLTGLTPETVYYYRVVAENSVELVYGPIQSFVSSYPFSSSEGVVGLPVGGEIYRPMPGPINASGRITMKFFAYLNIGSVTVANDAFLMSDSSGTMTVLGREGQVVAGLGTMRGFFENLVLLPNGHTVVRENFSASGRLNTAFLTTDNGLGTIGVPPMAILSKTGDAVAEGGVFKTLLGAPVVDDNGVLCFGNTRSGAGVNAKNDTGIWCEDAGRMTCLALEGQAVPGLVGATGLPNAWYGNIKNQVVAGGGGAAFVASFQGNPANRRERTLASQNSAVLSIDLDAGGDPVIVVRRGLVVPGTGGRKWNNLQTVSRGTGGDHAVLGLMSGSKTSDQVLVAVDAAGTGRVVVQEGVTVIPGTGLPVDRFLDTYVVDNGDLVFRAYLRGANAATDEFVCRWSAATGLQLVLREGGSLPAPLASHQVTAIGRFTVSPGGNIGLSVASSAPGLTHAVLRDMAGGAGLEVVEYTGRNVWYRNQLYPIIALGIFESRANNNATGGLGVGINDAGQMDLTLDLGGTRHVIKVYD